jgi:CopG family nickel-responsive transcriptional regulator
MNSKVRRFSVTSDPILLDEFDETIKKLGYTRSSAIQRSMRNFLADHRWTIETEIKIAGAITMIYDHEARGLGETLTHIQHIYRNVIFSTTHVHLDEYNCLEIIAVRGLVKEIKNLEKELTSIKGIKQLKVATLILK